MDARDGEQHAKLGFDRRVEDESNSGRGTNKNDLSGGWRSYIHALLRTRIIVFAKRITCQLWCGLLVLIIAGCGGAPPSTTMTGAQPNTASSAVNEINQSLSLVAAQSGDSADYRIGPDDLLQMTIYNIPEQDARVTPRVTLLRVSQDGLIVAPLVGTVQVKGKTPRQLEQDLRQRYEKYIKSPQIGVLVTEYRQRVSVMGAVQKPGVFELTGPKTVIDMVALAGGITEKAGNQVHLYRQDAEGRRQTAVIDLLVLANPAASQVDPKDAQLVNVPVQAGDVINVPQAGMYFVDGAVHKPGSYPIGRNYTVTQALAAAGGLDPELADSDSITIYRRRSPTDMETIPVNIDEVLARKRPDLQVQPDDVIVVPMSSAKYFVKRFVGSLIGGVSVGQAIR